MIGLTAASFPRRKPCATTFDQDESSKIGWQGGAHKFGVSGVLEERINGQIKSRTPNRTEKSTRERERVARETSRNRNFDDDFVIVTESESGEDSQLPEQEEEPIEEVDLVYVMDDEEQDDLEAQQHDGPDTRSNGVEEAQETRETGCDELALPENHEDTNRDTMTKAYDEMTRGAVSMTGTPSKKRSRTVAPSDATSSNEPISPHKYGDSDLRPMKRLCSSDRDNRRSSAPSEMIRSPHQTSYANDMPNTDDFEGAPMKQEPTGPNWMRDGIALLLQKFEGSLLEPDGSSVRCLDCPTSYKTTLNKTFGPVETHLRGKGHIAKVKERMEKQSYHQPFPQNTKSIDFNMLAEPVAAYANHERPQSSNLLAQFLTAEHLEKSRASLQIGMIQQRLSGVEQKISPLEAQMTELVTISRTGEEKYQLLLDRQEKSEEIYDRDYTDLDSRLVRHSDRQDDKLKEVEHTITRKILESDQLTALGMKMDKNQKDIEEKVKALNEIDARSRHQVRDEVGFLQEKLDTATEASTVQLDDMSHRLSRLEQKVEVLNEAGEKRESDMNQLRNLCKRTATDLARSKDADAATQQRITTLESNSRWHTEQIRARQVAEDRLRLELEIRQEEGKKHRQKIIDLQRQASEEQFKQTLMDHIASQFESRDAKLKEIEARHQRYTTLNKSLWERFRLRNTERHRASEESNRGTLAKFSVLEDTVKAISSGALALETKVNEANENVNDNFEENDRYLTVLAEEVAKIRNALDGFSEKAPETSNSIGTARLVKAEENTDIQSRVLKLEEALQKPSESANAPPSQLLAQIPDFTAIRDKFKTLEPQLTTLTNALLLHTSRLAALETSLIAMKQEFQDQNVNTSTQVSTLTKGVQELQKSNRAMEEGSKNIEQRIEMVIPLIFNEIKEVRRGVNELAEELEDEGLHGDGEDGEMENIEELQDGVGEDVDDGARSDEQDVMKEKEALEEEQRELSGGMADDVNDENGEREAEQEVKMETEEDATEDGRAMPEDVEEKFEEIQPEQVVAPLVSTLPDTRHGYKDPYEEVTDEEESGEEEDDEEEELNPEEEEEEDDDDDDEVEVEEESVHSIISENSDMLNESSPEPKSVLDEIDSESVMDDDDISDAVLPSIE
ncbi:hypothetical protein GLAREA_04029 [Glarea lozoyensis ATCC 20868]|uniref:Uncharacterized protein n=1 Tax=Glarea lozoyensis (strain ATCC 20868 / MF5171) TaxID=1116229 RepID=S3CXJ1_GLAL2|nr:uncharacterized protein GLAREA_04029 [Glarea lozoyensis ATCC 20868]EPE31062.1 hypothetical protein GLAREA_04029 [Glarea lozoyensis ATCC 20868]